MIIDRLPRHEELSLLLNSRPLYQIAEAIQDFRINIHDPIQYILTEKQKETLISTLYGNMQADDFTHLQNFAILPSRDLMLKMIDNGISLPLALVLLYNYRVQDLIQSIIIEDQKKQLVELIYSRMHADDFLSLCNLDIIPSITLLRSMITKGFSPFQCLTSLHDIAITNYQEEDQHRKLILEVLLPEIFSRDFGPANLSLLHLLPAGVGEMTRLAHSYGLDVLNRFFAVFLNYTPQNVKERQGYYDLKDDFLNKYGANFSHWIKYIEQALDGICLLHPEDGKTDPIYREGVLKLSSGREVKFGFLGTTHGVPFAALPEWMREIARNSDHLLYEGMSGISRQEEHEVFRKYADFSFDTRDLHVIKKIATLYKNCVMGIEGDALDSEIKDYISLPVFYLPTTISMRINSYEFFVKSLFAAADTTNLECQDSSEAAKESLENASFECSLQMYHLEDRWRVLGKDLSETTDQEMRTKLQNDLYQIEFDMETLFPGNINVTLKNFDGQHNVNLSSFATIMKIWEWNLDLMKLNIQPLNICEQSFSEMHPESWAPLTVDDFYILSHRNKIWIQEIISSIRENPHISNPLILSGAAHTPDLIVRLAHMGVEFSADVLEDSYRFLLDTQLMLGTITYNFLLRINDETPTVLGDHVPENQMLLGYAY